LSKSKELSKKSSNQAIKQSSNQAIKQSSNQAIKRSSNQAIKRSSNQTDNLTQFFFAAPQLYGCAGLRKIPST
jgi:hypothetical protein